MTITQANTSGTPPTSTGPNVGRISGVTGVDLRTGSQTLAFRVKWATASTTVDMYGPTMSVAANGRGIFIERRSGDASTVVIAYRYSGTTFSTVANATGAYGSTTNWVHICVTYDGTTIRTYVDGVASGTAASASTFLAAGANDAMSLCGPINGEVADVCFFSRALSAAEVLQLSAIRQPASLARGDCLGWYPAIETSSLTNAGIDYSGSGNHCTLQASGSNNPAVGSVSVPEAWGGPSIWQALRIAPVAIVGAGSSQTTGAGTITKSAGLVAGGTTQCTGTANVTQVFQITAAGTTQTSGAAVGANQLESPESYPIDNSHTWAAWVYPTSSQVSDILKAYAVDYSDSNPQGVSISGTTVTFYATNTTGSPSSYSFSQALAQNAWTHVALVYDSVAHTCTSYVNGVSVNSGAYNGSAGAGPESRVGFMNNVVGTMRDALIVESVLGPVDFAHIMRERVANALYVSLAGGIVSGVFAPIWSPFPSGYYRWGNPNGFSQLLFRGVPVFGREAPPAAWTGSSPLVFRTVPAVSITATGSTQTTGAAASTEASALVASGTTNTSGAAVVTQTQQFQITGAGLTNTTGAGAITAAAPLVAAGNVTTSGAAAATKAAGLVAAGSVQVTGSAAGSETAALVASGLTQVSALASPSGALLVIGTTNTTGAAVVTLTQTFQITGAGLTNVSGVAALAITYPQAAAGSTQVTGVATLSLGPAGGGVAGNQTGGERRWSDTGGMRRKTRR